MNIFITDLDPYLASQNLCDKHISKMFLESCQLMCSIYPNNIAPYKRTHYNHPCCIWTRSSVQNYEWLLLHAFGIAEEYNFRYKKTHKCTTILKWCHENYTQLNLPNIGLTKFALAMPDRYKEKDPIISYRNYYLNEKKRFAKWDKGRGKPLWWVYKS